MFKHEDLNNLFDYYCRKFNAYEEKNSFKRFNKLYELESLPIDEWLQFQMDSKVSKSNSLSTSFRKEGNKLFCEKNENESLKFYTKSLCYAVQPSEEFCLALANRSAVTFEKGLFDDCLKDIEICLESPNYPDHLKFKLFLRKARCLKKLKREKDFETFLLSVQDLFNKSSTENECKYITAENKEKYLTKLSKLIKEENTTNEMKQIPNQNIPTFDTENPNFINASEKIKMVSNKMKGRHVIAKENIMRGEIIFIEKSFCFTPIFNVETFDLKTYKCYHCLRNIFSGLPCKFCLKCVFCNDDCRNSSWMMYHQYECVGMQTNIWYHLGITQAAFRILTMGNHSNLIIDDDEETEQFTDKKKMYSYFNSLTYHIRENEISNLISSAIVIRYLQNHTDYFKGASLNFVKKCGGLIAKYILQLENNSSIIEHWIDDNGKLPKTREPIACGIFPSVSMMNHSCKPNITNFFICDTIVVKALEDIKENDEIFNCYGVDYRVMDMEERQNYCKNVYNFECRCEICSDPQKEMKNFDKMKCPECEKLLQEMSDLCDHCKHIVDPDLMNKMNIMENKRLAKNDENFLVCLKAREKLLKFGHSGLSHIYHELYNFYKETGNILNMLFYFEKWFENEKLRTGEISQKMALTSYEICSEIFYKKSKLDEFLLNKVEFMLNEAISILSLHYPQYIIDNIVIQK